MAFFHLDGLGSMTAERARSTARHCRRVLADTGYRLDPETLHSAGLEVAEFESRHGVRSSDEELDK